MDYMIFFAIWIVGGIAFFLANRVKPVTEADDSTGTDEGDDDDSGDDAEEDESEESSDEAD